MIIKSVTKVWGNKTSSVYWKIFVQMLVKKNKQEKFPKIFNPKSREEIGKLYFKGDVFLLTDIFVKVKKVSIKEFEINPLYCISLPSYTWLCGLKYTDTKLQKFQDKELFSTLKNNIRRGISSVMGDCYKNSDENKKILFVEVNNFYGWAVSERLRYDENKFDKNFKLEDIMNTPDGSRIGYFIEVDIKYPDETKLETEFFPFCPENEKIIAHTLTP